MWYVCFRIEDGEAIYAELRGRGAAIDDQPGAGPDGVTEFGVQDVDDRDAGSGEAVRG